MKIRVTISSDFDLDKCYPGHDPKRHSRGFSANNANNANNANIGGIIIFKSYNSKNTS